MRVLILSGIYPPDIGGPATFVPRFADFLCLKNHRVEVISLTSTEGKSFKRNSGARITLVSRRALQPFRSLLICFRIIQKGLRSDLIIANGLYYEHVMTNLLLRKPYIYKIVGDPVWERFKNKTKSKVSIEDFSVVKSDFSSRILRKVLSFGLKNANKIVVPGANLIPTVELWLPKREVLHIDNGVPELLLEKLPIRYDVISTSRLVSWKNVDRLIRATSLAGLRLAIAGDGPERDALTNLASELSANVDFLGELSSEEIQNALAESKIYALISSYEGMSFGLLEAMMQEMLILVSNIPANTAVIKDGFNGLVVKDSDPESIAQQLVSLLGESSSSLSKNARKTALAQFSETEIFEKYIGLMSDAIK